MKKQILEKLEVGSPSVAEIKLTYSTAIPPEDRRVVVTPDDLYDVLREWWDWESVELYETFFVLLMDRQNRIIGIYKHTKGGSSAVMVDTKLIMAAALKCNANCIVLAHNHPSGSLKASAADITATMALATLGKLQNIPVLDHIIISPFGGYYSFAEHLPDTIKGYRLEDFY